MTKRSLAALGLLAFGPLLAAPALAQTTLRFVPHAEIKIVDPVWSTGYITRNHGFMVYDQLFALNGKLEPQPQMIASHKVSADGLVWDFTLRPGQTWHDGKPVTAADCIASIQRFNRRDVLGQRLLEATASMEAVDAGSFRITLKKPFGLMLDLLAKSSNNPLFMMPERVAKTDPFTQFTDPTGSGPFQFVPAEWVPGVKAVYRKFDGYKPRAEAPDFASGGKLAKVDRIEWLVIPDASTQIAALGAGEVDMVEQPPIDLLPPLKRNKDVVVKLTDTLGGISSLRINHLHPPMNNPKIRQALLLLLDQTEYMQVIVGDPEYWKLCPSYFGCGTPMSTLAGTAEFMGPKNMAKAKQLIAESGYKGERIALLDPADNHNSHSGALITVERLRAAGLNVDLQTIDWTAALGRINNQEGLDKAGWSLFHTFALVVDSATPAVNTALRAGGAKNAAYGWPEDAAIDQMRAEWLAAATLDERKAIAARIQERGFQTVVPYIPLGQYSRPMAWRANVSGVLDGPIPVMWNIEKK
jgi:peptide/nickel transport system substrate-binding protein